MQTDVNVFSFQSSLQMQFSNESVGKLSPQRRNRLFSPKRFEKGSCDGSESSEDQTILQWCNSTRDASGSIDPLTNCKSGDDTGEAKQDDESNSSEDIPIIQWCNEAAADTGSNDPNPESNDPNRCVSSSDGIAASVDPPICPEALPLRDLDDVFPKSIIHDGYKMNRKEVPTDNTKKCPYRCPYFRVVKDLECSGI